MKDIEQEVAELLEAGLAGMGVFDDWDEFVLYFEKEQGKKAALEYAEKVARVIDWMNARLPKKEQVSPGEKFLQEAKDYLLD